MAAARFLRPDAVARAAATPFLRLVQDATLRAWHRPDQPARPRLWRGAAISITLHAAMIAAFLWQTTGGERQAAAAIDVVFQQVAPASAEPQSGDAQMKIEEAPPPADLAEADTVLPVDAPPVASAETIAPAPVEQVVAVPATPTPPPPDPVAQVAADVPAEAVPPPPPPRPVARKRPVEVPPRLEPKPARTDAAAEAARETSSSAPPADAAPGAPAVPAAPVSVAAAPTAAASTPRPPGDIPVVHDARFRLPPTPARYPPRAVDLSQQGTVIVRALVGPDGAADDIIVWRSSGYALLDAAALRAVRGWSFEPASVGGRRITAWVEVPVRFAIR